MKLCVVIVFFIILTAPLHTLPGKRSKPGEHLAPDTIITPYGTYKIPDLQKILKRRNLFRRMR